MTRRDVQTVFGAFVVTATCAVTLHAQSITGTVTGNVSDTSGAVVPRVEMSLINADTGVVRTASSDERGNFRFLLVPPGEYAVEASLPGFRAFRRAGIVVEADRSLAVPVQLEVGELEQTIEVQAGTPLLETNTSSLGTVVDEQKIESLPLLGRNPTGLANLLPTVRGIGFFGGPVLSTWRLAGVTIGGGDPLSSSTLVDGMAMDKMQDGGALVLPTVEGTREFKVVTNAMSAEFGRTAGGIMSIITKAGTNDFHGNLFEYLRNDAFNANEFFANKNDQPKPRLRWNQFGGSLGGPVFRNRLFFFGTYEGYRERRQQQTTLTVPTERQRRGDFSDTRASNGDPIVIYDPLTTRPDPERPGNFIRDPFPRNVIPEDRLDPVAQAVLDFVPLPNVPGLPVTGAENFFASAGVPIDKHSINVRLDYNLTSSRRLSGRYIYEKIDWGFANFFDTIAGEDGRNILVPRHSPFLQYTDTLSPTFLIDAKVGFTYENEHWTVPAAGFDVTSIGMPVQFQNDRQKNGDGFPRFSIADATTFGRPNAAGNPSTTGTASVALTKLFERHSLKFGYEHRVYRRNEQITSNPSGTYSFTRGFTQGPDPLQASVTAGYGVASFLVGLPASGSAGWSTDTTRSLHYDAVFIQDDWNVSPTVTLNLGLRWEYEGPVKDRFNVLSNFDPTIPSPLEVPGLDVAGGLVFPGEDVPRGLTEPSYTNVGPRFGFAYHPFEKSVLRGGYGIMYIPTTGTGYPTTGFSITTPMVTTLDGGVTPHDDLSDPFPDGIIRAPGASQGVLTGIGTSVAGQLRDVQRGYSQQWNLTIQHEPWDDWLIEVAYIGNKGTRLQRSQALNFLSEEDLALGNQLVESVPNPFFGIIETGPLNGETVPREQLLLPFPQFTGASGGVAFRGNSIYHAGTLKVEKRFSDGFSLLMAYTKSKLIDDGRIASRPGSTAGTGVQNWNNLRAERSKSLEDVPQRMVLATSWALPFAQDGDGILRHLVGGWQINTITTIESGRPISLSAPVTGPGTRPNAVPDAEAKLDDPTLERWFNTDAFALPEPFTFGDAPRTLPDVHSDGLFRIDLSLFKTFPIADRYRLQFRAEAFNLTNTPTFDTPGRSLTGTTFGVVTATTMEGRPRELQFALRLDW
ncbi:MAG: hypothetical protein GEV06_20505 [Luteitalea sp.]|nr:hypothetical protein [Luteitalea sp.]